MEPPKRKVELPKEEEWDEQEELGEEEAPKKSASSGLRGLFGFSRRSEDKPKKAAGPKANVLSMRGELEETDEELEAAEAEEAEGAEEEAEAEREGEPLEAQEEELEEAEAEEEEETEEELEEEEAEEEEAEEPAEASALPRRVGLGRGLESLIPRAEAAPAPPLLVPAAPPAPVPVAPAAAVIPAAAAAPAEPAQPAAAEEAPPSRILLRPGDRVEEPSRLRVRIAEHMVANRRTAAHVWTAVEADFEVVERVRRRHQDAFKAKEGFSLTYLPFIARATIDALNAFPVVNSSFYLEEKKSVLHAGVNLGIAVDMDQRGLIVMNIPGADGMRMRELARRIRGVAEKARSGNLSPDDAAGSTFTITNPGPYGSLMSAPIINVPEVAILSTDTVAKRPVVVTDATGADAIAVHHVGYLGLTWDHRAFDGSTAVLFLRKIKETLEARDWEQELA